MQPYLFPYLGYWQMLNNADVFVVLDDVNFIKKGWINRNNILLNGQAHLFSLPLRNVSQNKLINETLISADTKAKQKILRTIQQCYSKAPCYEYFYPIVEEIFNYDDENLSGFLVNQFAVMFKYMGITTKILISSQLSKDNTLRAQDRILDICVNLKTQRYVNAIGGQELYDAEAFRAKNIELKFIKMRALSYPQGREPFVPGLSIIDVLMHNDLNSLKALLGEYDMI